jgi:hypothetical protein
MAAALMRGIPITHRDFSTGLTLAVRNERVELVDSHYWRAIKG